MIFGDCINGLVESVGMKIKPEAQSLIQLPFVVVLARRSQSHHPPIHCLQRAVKVDCIGQVSVCIIRLIGGKMLLRSK